MTSEVEDKAVLVDEYKVKIAKELWERLITNDDDRGGRICLVTGEQGCGKTTFLRRVTEEFLKQETIVIWRGREFEQVHWFENWKERCLFHYHEDDDFLPLLVVGDSAYRISDLNVRTYRSPKDLLSNLEPGRINVVFEPTEFYFDEELNLLDIVRKSLGLRQSMKVEGEPQEGSLFWFEVLYLLIIRLDTNWYALIIDECDDIFPENPKSLRWRLQEWAKNSIKDLRKARVSLIMSTHSLTDIDYRIRSKIQFFVYMKNAKIPDGSTIKNHTLANSLDVGQFIIENGYFGTGKVEPYERPFGDFKVILRRKRDELGRDSSERAVFPTSV